MAVIKAVNSKASISKAIKYVTEKEKTEEKLVSGKDCTPSSAIEEMNITKELWHKKDGRQYTHLIQSFNPEDNIRAEKAHEIGRAFIEQSEKFRNHEVLIATHVDKDHIHNHFIVNSVNFENGKKFHVNKKELENWKEESNQLSRENGLIVPQKGDHISSYSQKKYRAIEKAFKGQSNSYLLDTAKEISMALKTAIEKKFFIEHMESKGYKVNWKDSRKNITFTTPDNKKVRSSNLEKTFKESKFSKEGIENEIQRNRRERGKEQGGESNNNRTAIRENQRTKSVNAELYQSTYEREYHDTSNYRLRARENKEDELRGSGENEINIERAREHSESLRRESSSKYGSWKERNEKEQSDYTRRDEADKRGDRSKSSEHTKRDEDGYKRCRREDLEIDR